MDGLNLHLHFSCCLMHTINFILWSRCGTAGDSESQKAKMFTWYMDSKVLHFRTPGQKYSSMLKIGNQETLHPPISFLSFLFSKLLLTPSNAVRIHFWICSVCLGVINISLTASFREKTTTSETWEFFPACVKAASTPQTPCKTLVTSWRLHHGRQVKFLTSQLTFLLLTIILKGINP